MKKKVLLLGLAVIAAVVPIVWRMRHSRVEAHS